MRAPPPGILPRKPGMIEQLRAWYSEFRRRRVFRVGGAYAAIAFIIWQAADIAFPALRLPEWAMTLVVVLALVGFPIALVFAWIFDVTPDGVRRTDSPAGAAPVLRPWSTRRTLAAAVVALVSLGGATFLVVAASGRGGLLDDERSIAVLPFENLSADAENEYFSDGVTEDILNRLSRIEDLVVISRTSVMGYRGRTSSVRTIAQELGVTHVLEGSVRRAGERLRISVKLVDAAADRSLWSETYDRELSDVFAIQSEIAEQIADALRVQLSGDQRVRLRDGGTGSIEAYEIYLQARKQYHDAQYAGFEAMRPAFRQMVERYRTAIARDPQYALPWVGLSEAYIDHLDLPRELRRDSAEIFARRAIALAPALPDAYVALAEVYMDRVDWPRAQVELQRAHALNPSNLRALLGLAELESGRYEVAEALRYALRATTVAPGDADALYAVADLYFYLGELERATEWLRRASAASGRTGWWLDCASAQMAALREDSATAAALAARVLRAGGDAPFAWNCVAQVAVSLGDVERAWPLAERYAASIDDTPGLQSSRAGALLQLGYLAVKRGDRAHALELLAEAERLGRLARAECPTTTCVNSPLVAITALQGRTDEAIGLLEDAVRVGWNGAYPLPRLPLILMYEPLYGDPRYQRIMGELQARLDAERAQARQAGM